MTWFRVDDGFHSHPKTQRLFDGPCPGDAIALWALAGSWSGYNLTDGRVPRAFVKRSGFDKRAAGELVRVGYWHEDEDGYVFHQWGDRNPLRAEVEAQREATRGRVAKHRKRDGNGVTSPLPPRDPVVSSSEVLDPIPIPIPIPHKQKRDPREARPLPLVPMDDAFAMVSECRKRNGFGAATLHHGNYREAEALCEQLKSLAADRNEPWEATLSEILGNFERDDFARSSRLALGVLVKDLGKWIGDALVGGSQEAYDAARARIGPQIDELDTKIRRLKSSREGEHAGDEIAELEAKRDELAAELARANPSFAVAASRRRTG